MSCRVEEQRKSEIISRIMGQNLLKGYALLDQYCNVCEAPLMRDPQKNLLCVTCELAKHEAAHLDIADTKESVKRQMTEAPSKRSLNECEAALREKYEWAVAQLVVATDVKHCIDLNLLLKSLSENIQLLRDIK